MGGDWFSATRMVPCSGRCSSSTAYALIRVEHLTSRFARLSVQLRAECQTEIGKYDSISAVIDTSRVPSPPHCVHTSEPLAMIYFCKSTFSHFPSKTTTAQQKDKRWCRGSFVVEHISAKAYSDIRRAGAKIASWAYCEKKDENSRDPITHSVGRGKCAKDKTARRFKDWKYFPVHLPTERNRLNETPQK